MTTDWTPWLGPAADELTDEQREHFDRLADTYFDTIASQRPDYGTEDYNEAEYFEEDTAALVAALEIAEGTYDLEITGSAYRATRTALYQGAIMSVLDGMTEIEAARQSTLPRMTLRKALGK